MPPPSDQTSGPSYTDLAVATSETACARREAERLRAEVVRLREVVSQQALQHPLPWRVESDWTEEVIASDGYCIAKCRTIEDAWAIVATAVALDEASRGEQPS